MVICSPGTSSATLRRGFTGTLGADVAVAVGEGTVVAVGAAVVAEAAGLVAVAVGVSSSPHAAINNVNVANPANKNRIGTLVNLDTLFTYFPPVYDCLRRILTIQTASEIENPASL